MKIESKKIQLPELNSSDGFWIGDPCYIYPNWSDFCSETFKYNDRESIIEYYCEFGAFWAFGTKWGDGDFPVYVEGEATVRLGVDAGMFAVIPLEAVKKMNPDARHFHLGRVVGGDKITFKSFSEGNAYFLLDERKEISIITDEE